MVLSANNLSNSVYTVFVVRLPYFVYYVVYVADVTTHVSSHVSLLYINQRFALSKLVISGS